MLHEKLIMECAIYKNWVAHAWLTYIKTLAYRRAAAEEDDDDEATRDWRDIYFRLPTYVQYNIWLALAPN